SDVQQLSSIRSSHTSAEQHYLVFTSTLHRRYHNTYITTPWVLHI
ncbi:unnamed protein product, partial [Allacma fusca]